jgi:Domain of unknown function (DUF4158)
VFSSEVRSSGEGTPVATRDVFSDDELAQLRGFPDPARAELIRYFTLGSADEAFVRKFLGQDNVMGVAVQLGTLPWLGFVPGYLGWRTVDGPRWKDLEEFLFAQAASALPSAMRRAGTPWCPRT